MFRKCSERTTLHYEVFSLTRGTEKMVQQQKIRKWHFSKITSISLFCIRFMYINYKNYTNQGNKEEKTKYKYI